MAVLGDDGVVRREEPEYEPRVLMADNARQVGRPRACCVNPTCGHQWRLRRRFDPDPAP
ncbi:hypothetical protein [Streptomyces sp. NPDC016845]|uniref:hypothetical protein n=1 Tax=Streptomyces sp. NPDC016845 TaxID=3364972 RepID=UPI0037BDFD10